MSARWATSMPTLPTVPPADFPMVPGTRRNHTPYVKMLQEKRPGSTSMIRPSQSEPLLRSHEKTTRPDTVGLGTVSPSEWRLKREGVSVPDYVTKEKQVLRFFAYFQEPIHEGGSMDTTGFRVRKFNIMYFLTDNTISIEEPRMTNSGIAQGKFMKRLQVMRPHNVRKGNTVFLSGNALPKKLLDKGSSRECRGESTGGEGWVHACGRSGNSIYAPEDFAVGAEVWISGRRFRIVDADLSTREWYKRNLKRTLKEAEGYPDDGYVAKRTKASSFKKRSMMPPREKGEFYKKDRKVLRFFCKYKDDRFLGDKRDYILHYYLLNDTIEIKEVSAEGRHNFPNLLRRQKLPKESMFVPRGYGGVISPRDPQRERVSSVTWEDLRCGEAINVYGRHLLLMACDSSTKDWYARRGVHQRPLIASHGEVEDHTEILTPIYNGYGNEDDLYAMGLSLEPLNTDVNQEEYDRFMKGDKKVLRFQAKLRNATDKDKKRNFVVNYFLADNTLSVFEPPVRNSGIIGGLFLVRGKYKKYIPAVGQQKEGTRLSEKITMDGGLLEASIGIGGQFSRWLKPTDFLPGSVVTFEMPSSGSKLFGVEILGHDEYTRKLLEDKEIFPQGMAHLAVTRLAEAFASAKLPVRSIFRSNDPSMKGVMLESKFIRTLRQIEKEATQAPSAKGTIAPLSDREMSEVVREFTDEGHPGPRGENKILYDDFVDMLVVASPSTSNLKDRGTKATLKLEARILKVMLAQFEENPDASKLRTAFRSYDTERNGTVKESQWVEVLRETKLSSVMTRKVAEAICLEHDTRGDGSLDYASFCDDIFAGDFDHYSHQQHFIYKDPAKDSDEEDLHGNDENTGCAVSSEVDELPEWNNSLRSSSASSLVSAGTPDGRKDSSAAEKGGKSPPKRRMTMSMVLPEGPVIRHRYQAPPTVQTYLDKMNAEVFDFKGDASKQLARAMEAFSSSFARTNRRKLLRKHFLAFDVNSTGRISREQFVETVHEVAREFFIDFDDRDKQFLASFFFPKEHRRIKYETLLEIITARDVRRAYAFRKQTAEEGAYFDELFTGIDKTSRKRDFGGTLNLFATAH